MGKDSGNTAVIEDAQYFTSDGTKDGEKTGVYAMIDGKPVGVPMIEDNPVWLEIKSRVDAGTLTIKDAD